MPRRPTRPWQDPRPKPRDAGGRRGRSYRLDLHGYDVLGAAEVCLLVLREAYANGYEAVELVHGAADVRDPVGAGEGRGAIKWKLRRMLDNGEFNVYVGAAERGEGVLKLRLRRNPQPRSESWPDLPPPRHR